ECLASGLDVGFKGGACLDPLPFAPAAVEPWREILGYAQHCADSRRPPVPCGDQASDLLRVAGQRSIGRQIWRKPLTGGSEVPTRTLCRPRDRGYGRCTAIQEHLDPRAARRLSGTEALGPAARDRRDRSFDVLAGAQSVDAVVDAAA